jgi:FAD/FMN-containing dehydrogenase
LKWKWIVGSLIIYGTAMYASLHVYSSQNETQTVEDAGKLLPTRMKFVHDIQSTRELQELIKEANRTKETVAIAGMQHSQGGHTLYPNGTLLDMKGYNKILAFHPEEKKITVQSGVTWADIQEKINAYGLSIKVMQSQNIFTVGGSLSVNVHGRDIRYGSLIDSVESFRLLNPDGEIINVSRSENSDLFPYVIGGYGLFGVILDVTLELADDELYQHRSAAMNYKEYETYFNEKVKQDTSVKMHLARISVARESFLQEMYVTDYVLADNQNKRLKSWN